MRAAALIVLGGGAGSLLAACGDSDEGAAPPGSVGGTPVRLTRQEGCSCCASYADYLEDNGFAVTMDTVDDLGPVRQRYAIPEDAVGCHTSVIDNYVIEGHVPVEVINRLLSERPPIDGISVAGMPANSPGMGDPNGEPLDILSFSEGRVSDYMSVTTY